MCVCVSAVCCCETLCQLCVSGICGLPINTQFVKGKGTGAKPVEG